MDRDEENLEVIRTAADRVTGGPGAGVGGHFKAEVWWALTGVILAGLGRLAIMLMLDRTAYGPYHQWVPWVAGAGLVVWLLAYLLERRTKRPIGILTAMLVGLAMTSVVGQVEHTLPKALKGDYVRSWNVFHYYVGSKYFPELGYFDLYGATLAADADFQAREARATGQERARLGKTLAFRAVRKSRDMRDYKVKPRREIVADFDRNLMSPERLEQLGEDTRFLRPYLGLKSWKRVMHDLGYNPAPPWTLVGTTLANLIPARWPAFWLISNSDLPVYLFTFLMAWWAFGLRIAAVGTLWITTIQFNNGRFIGGFLQYDWLASAVACVAFYRRGRFRAAGVALSWGAMTRVFPGFLIFPIVLKAGIDWYAAWQRRREARGESRSSVDPSRNLLAPADPGGQQPLAGQAGEHGVLAETEPGRAGSWGLRSIRASIKPAHWQFLTGFTLACGLLFVGSHATGQGLNTWPSWVQKISRHSSKHAITSNQRIGVGRLAQHYPIPGRFWAQAPGRGEARLAHARGRKLALQLIGFALLLPALIRRRDEDAIILALFSVLLGVTLSRYYASAFVMVFALGAWVPSRAGPGAAFQTGPTGGSADGSTDGMAPVWAGSAGVFAGAVLLLSSAIFYLPGGDTAAYFLVNWLYYLMFCLLCVAYLMGDIKAWRGARGAS